MSYVSDNVHLDDDREIEAIEGFVVDTQIYLNEIMERKGISRAELARRMGVSRPRVSQMFGEDCNLTVRQLARVAFHLGEEPRVESESTRAMRNERAEIRRKAAVDAAANVHVLWKDVSAENLVDTACSYEDYRIDGLLARASAR